MINKPKLRFKEFQDDWQQSKMEDLLIKVGDGLHGTPKYVDSGTVLFINGNNIKNGFVFTEKAKKVDEEQKSKDDLSLNENTILMSINGTIGNLAYYNHENIKLGKSVAYMNVDTKKTCKEFIFVLLQTNKVLYSFYSSLTGTTIKNLGLGSIKKTSVKTPKTEKEQRQIGLLFNKIDNLIKLKGKKITSLEQIKRGYLQKLFNDPYENKPKLRFKEFKDDWKAKKLGKEFDLQTGKSKFVKHTKDNKFKYPILSSNNIVGFADTFDYKGNFLLIARVGDAGKLYKYNGKVKITDNTMYINSKYSGFLFNLLKNYNFDKISFGTTRKLIKSSELKKIIIRLPSEVEMMKLDNIVKLIDKQINLQKQELDRLKSIKKGYLQKMFV